jgi:hypothetical protein
MSARRMVGFAVAAVMALAALTGSAGALSGWRSYMPGIWKVTDASGVVTPGGIAHWYFSSDYDFQPVEWQLRASNAAFTWNDLNTKFKFQWEGYTPASATRPPCYSNPVTNPPPLNALHVGNTGFPGVTYACEYNGTMLGFQMVIDPAFQWYTGTGSPNGLVDMQSVYTHEFGHAAGWGPFHYRACSSFDAWGGTCTGTLEASEPTSICDPNATGSYTNRATMCAQVIMGDAGQRDLGGTDKQVFYGGYPKNNTPVDPPDVCRIGQSSVAAAGPSLPVAPTSPDGTPIVC